MVINVPVVGSVTLVNPVVVKVKALAPDVVKLPPSVIVLEPLLTPVPPYVAPTTEPFQVPDVIVPTDTKLVSAVTAVLTSVPDVGNVTLVDAVEVMVVG